MTVVRLLPRPGLLTGLVVSASVVAGLVFGAAVVTAGLAVRRLGGGR